ncbi:MAG: PepSY domain-containing protein [Gammaproteobacteria bacterium]|nr:PepSY domain-containing protein [Gammaproteobacteria bacterium]
MNAAFSQGSERYTLDQAVALVKKTFGGQVLKATSTEQEGRHVYQIRVLTEDGRVRTFTVDALDGQVE